MTSFANKMQIFLWQIATVIPIKGARTSVDMPGFQTKSLTITIVCGSDFENFSRNFMGWFAHMFSQDSRKISKPLPQTILMVKPGISTLVLVPLVGMTVAIFH